MISGTSKIWLKSGPVDFLTITKMLQKIEEQLWNHPGKYYLCQYGTHVLKMFEKSVGHRYHVFRRFLVEF